MWSNMRQEYECLKWTVYRAMAISIDNFIAQLVAVLLLYDLFLLYDF